MEPPFWQIYVKMAAKIIFQFDLPLTVCVSAHCFGVTSPCLCDTFPKFGDLFSHRAVSGDTMRTLEPSGTSIWWQHEDPGTQWHQYLVTAWGPWNPVAGDSMRTLEPSGISVWWQHEDPGTQWHQCLVTAWGPWNPVPPLSGDSIRTLEPRGTSVWWQHEDPGTQRHQLIKWLEISSSHPNAAYYYVSVNWISIRSDYGLVPNRQAIVNWTLGDKRLSNLNKNSKLFIHENAYENVICEMATILCRGRWVKACPTAQTLSMASSAL